MCAAQAYSLGGVELEMTLARREPNPSPKGEGGPKGRVRVGDAPSASGRLRNPQPSPRPSPLGEGECSAVSQSPSVPSGFRRAGSEKLRPGIAVVFAKKPPQFRTMPILRARRGTLRRGPRLPKTYNRARRRQGRVVQIGSCRESRLPCTTTPGRPSKRPPVAKWSNLIADSPSRGRLPA